MGRSIRMPRFLGGAALTLWVMGCSATNGGELGEERDVELESAALALRGEDRLAACEQDPRVLSGLVSREVCAGAAIFFEETFEGNGRTCGSCHPAANNTTLDVAFIEELHQANPRDPLFVSEFVPELSELETSDLRDDAAILENVDGFGFSDRFVSRGVNHVLSLSTSLARDPGDPNTTNPPAERTGWAGDGSPDGTLRGFLRGAIEQHFPKTLDRVAGSDFRLPEPLEEELVESFQLSLGRRNELDLQQVRLTDEQAESGRQLFLDDVNGRCNVCHTNAGANFKGSRLNRNFDTNTRSGNSSVTRPPLGEFTVLLDAGFGGRDLPESNFPDGNGGFNGFGNGSFNPPPLIEAADTAPFFHNNLRTVGSFPDNISGAVLFYTLLGSFLSSPAAQELDETLGPLDLDGGEAANLARFLRVLNAALNIDIARQRASAVAVLLDSPAEDAAIQATLLGLARNEVDDALDVLIEGNRETAPNPIALDHLEVVRSELTRAIDVPAERAARTATALDELGAARGDLGTNIDFVLGAGNLMF